MSTSSLDPIEKLHGTQVLLRLLTEDDVAPLAEILAHPDISRWWGVWDAERIQKELLESTSTVVYVIEFEGEVVGSIQYTEEPSADYRHAGMDLFLSAARHGRGLGSDAVRTVARHLMHDRGHHRLVIDPQVDNEAAVRCYESVGFRKVGMMRAYERGPDGDWHDCLMLEVLKDELA